MSDYQTATKGIFETIQRSSYSSGEDTESLLMHGEEMDPRTESTESLWANSEGMDYEGTTSTATECKDKTKCTRIYSANEVCEIIVSSHSEVSSSSCSDEDCMCA